MQFKTRNHRSANSAEYINGCPGEWLRETIAVSDEYKLSQKEIDSGFVLLETNEVETITSTYKDAYIVWKNSKLDELKQATNTIRQEAVSLRNDLITIKNSSSNQAIVKLAESLLFIIKNTDLNLVD